MIKPGVKLSDIDKCARKVISDEGYGKYFTHRLGHFIGRDVHEYGDVSSVNEMEVEEGMIFSIEPGIYLEGNFGVRVEDLVMVKKIMSGFKFIYKRYLYYLKTSLCSFFCIKKKKMSKLLK